LKTSGPAAWPLLDRALESIRQARAAGLAVAADRYPYTASHTDLDVVFPAWAEEGGRAAVLARLRDPAVRAAIRADLLRSRPEDYWGAITIGSTAHPDLVRFRGRLLADVARELNLEPVDALLHLTERDELRTSAFFAGMSEDNLWRILAEPYVMLGTDASLRAPDGPLSDDFPHPRAYGSFPRFLRAALDGRTVALAEAVRKLTALPAAQFGLADRGLLARGLAADLVVFDPLTVADRATYSRPQQTASGIETVIVNGVITLRAGQLSGRRAGVFL
jgi:N-acyl-D-amino-acid deacylase